MLLGAGVILGKGNFGCLAHGLSSDFRAKIGKESNNGMWIEIVPTICFSLKNSLKISGVFGKRGCSGDGLGLRDKKHQACRR